MAAFAAHPNPYYALGHALWGAGWWFVVLALINSAIGVGLACTNSASRVMYTMGQAGTLPARFGQIDPVHQTPAFAIAVVQIVGIVAVLLIGLLLQPSYIFGLLENHCHAGGDRDLLHGEPGAYFVHAPGACRRFQRLASRCITLDRNPARLLPGALCDHLSCAGVAV